jgi:2-hydroxy-3-oxopropionate reductase
VPGGVTDRRSIGFIGLGVMGLPMAQNLLRGGCDLVVHTRSRSRATPVEEAGARWVDSPAAVAAATDVIVTMLPDSSDVETVVAGPAGVLEGARSGSTWIDMSSIAPLTTRRLAAEAASRGVGALDAPVSGGEAGAKQATLTIMVGGDAEVFARAEPVLRQLGTSVTLVGDVGAGQVAKTCNQLIVGGTIALVAEALVLAAKADVDPARVREALLGGFAQSRVLEVHGERMLRAEYDPGFRIALHQKDLSIALDLARSVGAAAPLAASVSQLMNARAALGGADRDHSSLATVYEGLADHRLAEP